MEQEENYYGENNNEDNEKDDIEDDIYGDFSEVCNDDGDLWYLHLTFDLYNPHLHVPSHLNTSEENGGEN
jgi:hypothetical protein